MILPVREAALGSDNGESLGLPVVVYEECQYNPFGYARQTFRFRGHKEGRFFHPARNMRAGGGGREKTRCLASPARAAIVGGPSSIYPPGRARSE